MCTWVHPQLLPLRNLPFPPPQKRPAAQPSTARPQSRKSPQICKSCFRQSALSPPQKRPAAQPSTARPQSRKSPKILQILLQTIPKIQIPNPAFRPFPAAKKTRRPTINRSPAIPKIPQNPANPASDNIHPKIWDAPLLSLQLDPLSLIRDTKRMEVLYTELFDK